MNDIQGWINLYKTKNITSFKAIRKVKNILNAKDRKYASASAPAKGLFLWKIEYPKDIKV